MSSIIYSDTDPPYSGPIVPYDRQNATSAYLKHYGNYLYLSFIYKNSDRTLEKIRAGEELVICERKLQHWRRHPNWIQTVAEVGVAKLKRDWKIVP